MIQKIKKHHIKLWFFFQNACDFRQILAPLFMQVLMLLRFLQTSIWQSFLPGKLDISTHWILHWIEEDSIYVGDVFVGCRSFIHLRLCLWSVTHPRYYSTGGGSFSIGIQNFKHFSCLVRCAYWCSVWFEQNHKIPIQSVTTPGQQVVIRQ